MKYLDILEAKKAPLPRVFYRGTRVGGNRSITGEPDWDNNLFMSNDRTKALLYGDNITVYEAKPDAKIVYEGTRAFISLVKGLNSPGWNFKSMVEVIRRAKAAGIDAVWFKRQADVGTVVINPDAFTVVDGL
jgi:hypothetical protein